MPREAKLQGWARPGSSCRNDLELVEGIRRGDESDFNELYERYFQRVYGFVYARLRNRADAEEVVQETFTAVFRSIEAYGGRSSVLSWIYGIAKNTVNNHVRRSKAHEQRVERAEQAIRPATTLAAYTPEEHLSLRRCESAIQERLASLGDWHVRAFVLRHVDDLPIDEIAKRVSRSNDAVRSSLYRVKRMLVEAVDEGDAVAR